LRSLRQVRSAGLEALLDTLEQMIDAGDSLGARTTLECIRKFMRLVG